MPIGPDQKNALNEASIEALEINFNRISSNFESNRWLTNNNRYEYNTTKQIEEDINSSSINSKELNEYIAASIMIHSLDAWSYFGKSISSLINGDIRIARHLIYYSELRSAMSILASQGIGVFKNKHVIIKTKDSSVQFNGPPTHDFVWDAIDYWIEEMNADESLLKLIEVENNSLDEWLNAFSINASTKQAIVKEFLLSIGFDLELFRNDRTARNKVSYRPEGFSNLQSLDYEYVLEQLKVCWSVCEPSSASSLAKLDKALLKRLIRISFKVTHPDSKSYKENPVEFATKVNEMFNYLGLTTGRIEWWEKYLSSESDFETEQIFNSIDSYKDIDTENYFFGMLYRSLFLLRISSLYCDSYVKRSTGYSKDSLSFWCNNIGINNGLWDDVESLTYISDLWEDIKIEIDDLNSWINSNPGNINLLKLHNEKPVSLSRLSSFERVGFWSFGL